MALEEELAELQEQEEHLNVRGTAPDGGAGRRLTQHRDCGMFSFAQEARAAETASTRSAPRAENSSAFNKCGGSCLSDFSPNGTLLTPWGSFRKLYDDEDDD